MDMTIHRTQEGSETWDAYGNIKEFEIKYFVTNPTSKSDAMQAVLDDSPVSNGDLNRSGVRFESYDDDGNMEISVLYEGNDSSGDDSDDDDDSSTVSFDCGGGNKHLTHSIKQTIVKGDIDPKGAIGWNGKSDSEMEISGVDVPTAQLRETYTRTMKLSRISTAFKRNVAALVGKVNSGSFKGWAAGEVMFLGMSYSCPAKKSTKVTVTFNFAIQPNECDVMVGDTSVSKKGYEYVWVITSTEADTDKGVPVMKTDGVFVDQVCEYASFAVLGL